MSSQDAHGWIGQTLAERYHVTEKLGAGGMGTVYKASDIRLVTDVVIKVPHPMMIRDAEFAARFHREIRSLVKLSHPNIVKALDVGVHDGLPFAVMQ
jgi:serine/threonine protein kinase